MHEYAEGKRINPKLTDLFSRADAHKAHEEEHLNITNRIKKLQYAIAKTQTIVGKMVESDEAVPQLKQTDTLIIADALRYLAKDTERHLADRTRADALRQQFLKYGASMCHSDEVKPTVIRSKTLLPTKDFKEWAKRVRETNPNVIVIPCDAEVVSADAVQIHNDGTLEVKVANAQKVGRVLVMDTDSHIGGGLFYPDDAVQGEECDHCVYKWGIKGGDE
jgi:hypothetical protein